MLEIMPWYSWAVLVGFVGFVGYKVIASIRARKDRVTTSGSGGGGGRPPTRNK